MANHPNRRKNYLYELVCYDHRGWGAIAEGLWSSDYMDRADRIFATAAEARAGCRKMRNAGCWYTEDEETGEREEAIPEFAVEKIAVYEACWLDPDDDQDVIDRIVELHGNAIKFADMPMSVAEFLITKYGGSRDAWMRESASLAGASSATHTAAFIGAGFAQRVAQIRALIARRGA